MLKRLIIKAWDMIKQLHPGLKALGGVLAALASLIAIVVFIRGHLLSHTWVTQLQNDAPKCEVDALNRATWKAGSSTKWLCSSTGLELVPSSNASLAEMELDQINGQSYDQSELDAQITVTLGNTPDDNTMAGLAVQVPQQDKGGYGLVINNAGLWELVYNKHQEISGKMTPQTIYHLRLKVDGGKIYGWINGKSIFTLPDAPAPSQGTIGLIIFARFQYEDGSNPPLASVYFTNFVLKL